MANFFDTVMAMGVDGITVSPGYAYERAPDQQHFLNRGKTKQLFRDIFKRGNGGKKWSFSQSGMFLDFLAGNQTYHCTPWGNPTRTVFGWQKPCYLLGEGYAKTFKELMESTDWDAYGVGNYEKCADCMVHSGFEATAVQDTFKHPDQGAGRRACAGIKTEGEMAPEISARKSAAGAIRLFTPRRSEAHRNSGEQGAQQASHSRVGFLSSRYVMRGRCQASRSTSSGKRGRGLAWNQAEGSRVWAIMNARNFAALAITAGLLAFAATASQAADGPLAHFAGKLVGQRQDHRPERIERAHPLPQHQQRKRQMLSPLSLRCASDSYKFELASDITSEGGNISGSWNETTRGVVGSLSGKVTAQQHPGHRQCRGLQRGAGRSSPAAMR